MKLTETKDGTIIEVFVKPNQPKFDVKIDGDEIVVFSTEEPVKGKVNKEIIKELTKRFHTKVELVSGSTSRQKRLLIRSAEKAEVERLLREKVEHFRGSVKSSVDWLVLGWAFKIRLITPTARRQEQQQNGAHERRSKR
jgi:uncharacterized protein (TIGR00251 family)